MEYDKSTSTPDNTPLETLPASDKHTTEQPRDDNSTSNGNHEITRESQHVRVASKPDVDISVLGTPITFPFCGKTAPNRFLKAPMTERLCRWNDEEKGEDVVSRLFCFVAFFVFVLLLLLLLRTTIRVGKSWFIR